MRRRRNRDDERGTFSSSPSFDLGGAMKTPPDSNVGVIIYVYDRARLGGRGSRKKLPRGAPPSPPWSVITTPNNGRRGSGKQKQRMRSVRQSENFFLPGGSWMSMLDCRGFAAFSKVKDRKKGSFMNKIWTALPARASLHVNKRKQNRVSIADSDGI